VACGKQLRRSRKPKNTRSVIDTDYDNIIVGSERRAVIGGLRSGAKLKRALKGSNAIQNKGSHSSYLPP